VRIGSRPPIERRGSHALGDPARLLVGWMRHATRDGRALPAGSVVTTGSWVGILPVAAGESVHAEFPGIGVASIRF
jgi:2-keto-4-pentenoate hydratase